MSLFRDRLLAYYIYTAYPDVAKRQLRAEKYQRTAVESLKDA